MKDSESRSYRERHSEKETVLLCDSEPTVQPCLDYRVLFSSPHLKNAEAELKRIHRKEMRVTKGLESCHERRDSIRYASSLQPGIETAKRGL